MRPLTRSLAAAAMLLTAALPAAGHEVGVLRPATTQFPSGGTVRLAGEKFSRETTLTLMLVGTRGRVPLGEVRTDSAGRFVTEVTVPDQAVEGSYRLVAFAPDGDRVAGLDVTVVAAAAATAANEHAGHEVQAPAPSAEPLELERARSAVVTGGAVGLIALSTMAGLVLLRRRTQTS